MKFYVPGKLLISGEYVVLNGATALAVPTKNFGQSLEIASNHQNHFWQSYDPDGLWFAAEFSTDLKQIMKTTDKSQAERLQKILLRIKQEKPVLFEQNKHFITRLEFKRLWGFGSSSTLIALLSQWSGVNAFHLLETGFGGSGYDVAVALENKPVLYRLKTPEDNQKPVYQGKIPVWEAVSFRPGFAGELFLVYLNQKQNSRQEIIKYQQQKVLPQQIDEISAISKQILQAGDLSSFKDLLQKHEDILSGILQRPTIKEALFPDFPGVIKSLGAWGGDFVLVTGKQAPEYFTAKGFNQILNFSDIL